MTENHAGSRPGRKPKANRGPSAGPENRAAIIAAAREIFAEEGIRAPLNAVARRAGVGQGSLYRHFPDRLTLALAVFDENVDELEALVGEQGRTVDDLFLSIAQQAMSSTALVEIMTQNTHDERALALAARVRAVVVALVATDREAGRIGRGVAPDDVLVAISMLAFSVAYAPEETRPEIVERARRLFHAAFGALGDADEGSVA